MEVNFHVDHYGDRAAIFVSGIALPKIHAFNSLFVQPHAQRFDDVSIVNPAIRADHHIQADYALIFCFSGFLGELRIGTIGAVRGAYPAFAQMEIARRRAGLFPSGPTPPPSPLPMPPPTPTPFEGVMSLESGSPI